MPPSPESPAADNRDRLIQAATAAFMEKGYRASIDDIAARAGVARQTVYNHFESKDLLFREVIGNAMRAVLVTLESGDGDLRAGLVRFAIAYRQKVLCPLALAMFRTIVAEAPRFPELAATFFSAGPEETIRGLAQFLARAMERGELRRDDPRLLAETLTGMLSHYDRLRGLFNPATLIDDDAGKTERIVDAFLRAHSLQG